MISVMMSSLRRKFAVRAEGSHAKTKQCSVPERNLARLWF
jgi:hypothetical protein